MADRKADTKPSSFRFRQFFLRGLATLLPTVLTLWLLVIAWNFLNDNIAQPINAGVRDVVVRTTPLPIVVEQDILRHEERLKANPEAQGYQKYEDLRDDRTRQRAFVAVDARRVALDRWWEKRWYYMDLIGLILAVVLVYTVGAFVGSFIGRRLYHRGERFITNLPLIRKVYPALKQVTDFFVGEKPQDKLNFSRVVAVQYPRKGLLSLGLVTGDTMRDMQSFLNEECLTVFIPSSPTPFTGYVITVPKKDTIDVPIPIDEALRFTVSGGVSIPDSQQILDDLGRRASEEAPDPEEEDQSISKADEQAIATTNN